MIVNRSAVLPKTGSNLKPGIKNGCRGAIVREEQSHNSERLEILHCEKRHEVSSDGWEETINW